MIFTVISILLMAAGMTLGAISGASASAMAMIWLYHLLITVAAVFLDFRLSAAFRLGTSRRIIAD